MKTVIKLLIFIILAVCLIVIYWIFVRYTDFIHDDLLEKGKWGNVRPVVTLITGLISLIILLITFQYYEFIFCTVKLYRSIKIGFFTSLFFILIATMFWSDSWTENPSVVLDSRELGDGIWKLGHPLTFLIIDLPIYLRHKVNGLQEYWSDLWAYPSVLILFVIQFSIYIHGLRMIVNVKKIKNFYNKQDSESFANLSNNL